ncbi:MAG: apolipoprotein N-acyltransferase [Actinomycetaceae bacterium]|nr:apolipoprotein N-acyltransferase [Actinomycetaceae bacterium]
MHAGLKQRGSARSAFFQDKTRALLLTLLGAGAFYTAFPPVYFWPGTIIGLTLLLVALENRSFKAAFALGWVFGAGFMGGHIWWIYVTEQSLLMWFLLVNLQAFFFALAALFWKLWQSVTNSVLLRAGGFMLLWPAFEQLRGHVPFTGFPWGYAAYALTDSHLRAWAPLGGEVLVSAVAALLAFIFSAVATFQVRRLQWAFVAVLAVFALPLVIPAPQTVSAGTLRIGVVQGNVEEPVKETYHTPNKVFNNHLAETELMLAAHQDVDLILWGETAIDLDPNWDDSIDRKLRALARKSGVPIVTGYISELDGKRSNLYGYWTAAGQAPMQYAKQELVPFGEYLPEFFQWGPFLDLYRYGVGDLKFGEKPGVLPVEVASGQVVKLSVGICFEAAFEHVFTDRLGALGELLVVPTNNSSFGRTSQSAQQMQMVQFRALEFQRPAIQVSTNGTSGIVSHYGTVMGETELFTADNLVYTVELRRSVGSFRGLQVYPVREAILVFPLIVLVAFLFAKFRQLPRRRFAGDKQDPLKQPIENSEGAVKTF